MDEVDKNFFRIGPFHHKPINISEDDKAVPACFFYGTLMVPHVLYRVIYGTPEPNKKTTRNILARPALLQNFERRRVRSAAYPGIVPKDGSQVRGTYIEGLTKANLDRLDAFEGCEYTLKLATVKVLNRKDGEETWEEKPVYTYVYTASQTHLQNEEWSFEDFIKMRAHEWAGVGRGKSLVNSDVDPHLGWYKDPEQSQVTEVHSEPK